MHTTNTWTNESCSLCSCVAVPRNQQRCHFVGVRATHHFKPLPPAQAERRAVSLGQPLHLDPACLGRPCRYQGQVSSNMHAQFIGAQASWFPPVKTVTTATLRAAGGNGAWASVVLPACLSSHMQACPNPVAQDLRRWAPLA